MKLLIVRSIPISKDTRAAWRANGALFMRRSREMRNLSKLPYDVILNLGDSSFEAQDELTFKWWNLGENIAKILTPEAMRINFHEWLPPIPDLEQTGWWHKVAGRGGSGNTFFPTMIFGDCAGDLDGDFQTHIDGDEYRLVTVGPNIVQQHKRVGPDRERVYGWLPSNELPIGIRPMVKSVAAKIPGHNVIAWDTIMGNRPYLLEGNASPGMNVATVMRVMTEIERQREESNA